MASTLRNIVLLALNVVEVLRSSLMQIDLTWMHNNIQLLKT